MLGWYNIPMKKNKKILIEIVGWYGAIAILVGYMLVSFEIISSSGLTFQLLNLTGAIGLISIALYKNVMQSVVLNIFWVGVAVIAIIRILV